MFSKKITRTGFSGHNSYRYFNVISENLWTPDESFFSTLCAVLHNRIDGEKLILNINRKSINPNIYSDHSVSEIFRVLFDGRLDDSNTLIVRHLVSPSQAFNDGVVRYLDDHAKEGLEEYVELQDLKAFCANAGASVRFYVNHDKHTAAVIISGDFIKYHHLVQGLIPRYLPWYFQSKPLTEIERTLFASLAAKTSGVYETLIQEMFDAIDLRSIRVEELVGGFEERATEREIAALNSRIQQIRNSMCQLMDSYHSQHDSLIRLNRELIGVRSVDTSNNDLLQVFRSMKCLYPACSTDQALDFYVDSYLDNFDPDGYLTLRTNPRSYIHDIGLDNVFEDEENRQLLLDAIFSHEPQLRVRMVARFTIIPHSRVRVHSGFPYFDEFKDRLPNPHIYHYACLGAYEPVLNELIDDNDMVGVLQECIAATKSFNIMEEPTGRRFLEDLFTSEQAVLELPDKTCLTPVQALEYLKNQEGENHA